MIVIKMYVYQFDKVAFSRDDVTIYSRNSGVKKNLTYVNIVLFSILNAHWESYIIQAVHHIGT